MNPTEEKIQQIFLEKFGIQSEQFTPQADLGEDLGLDSLDAVEVVIELEQAFNVIIADQQAEGFRTIGDILVLVTRVVTSGKRPRGSRPAQRQRKT